MVALQALKKVPEPLRQGGEADGRLKPRKTGICTVCRNIDISRGVTSAPPQFVMFLAVELYDKILTQFQKKITRQKRKPQFAKISISISHTIKAACTVCQPCAALAP